MARAFTASINTRLPAAMIDAITWYAASAEVSEAVAVRFFLPSAKPNLEDEDQVADAAELIEQLREYSLQELDLYARTSGSDDPGGQTS